MKKIVLPIAAVLSCVMAAQSAMAASFTDIKDESHKWCADQIERMADAGYINGDGDGTFRPDDSVTKLECIALFARAMGCNEEENKSVLALAHEQYDSAIKSSGLSWGEDEIVYMMYKKALTAADLTTYINGATKNQAMTRGEAAVIITKAMGGEQTAKENSGVSLDYKDKSSIPSNYLQYVQYVTDQGIMNGIDDAFVPSGTVTRAQIAVMLDRVTTKCDYSFYLGNLDSIDTENSKVTLTLKGKSDKEYDLNNVVCSIKGETAAYSDMVDKLSIIATFSGDDLISIDALTDTPDEELTVIYTGQSSAGTLKQIKVKDSESSTVIRTFTLSDDCAITYDGSPATISSLQSGDSITITTSSGKVTSIVAQDRSITITGATVKELSIDEKDGSAYMTISSSDSAYDGKVYPVSDSVSVTKNTNKAELSDIYTDDRVTLTVKYGQITKIEATSNLGSVSGTLVSLTIATQPQITVNVDGKEKSYTIPQDCEIYVNQKEATLYDFRVGDSLVLTTNASAVTKIQCSTSTITTNGSVTGVVTAVNKSYGFVAIMTDSSDVPISVFAKDSTTTIIDSKGKTMKLDGISIGDTVEFRGETKNGAFSATLAIVTKTAD